MESPQIAAARLEAKLDAVGRVDVESSVSPGDDVRDDSGGNRELARALTAAEAEEVLAKMRLELDGFCVYTAVQRDGLLLPASSVAVAAFHDRYYGFVDADARDAFVGSPDKYHAALLGIAKRMPELIHMLNLQEYFPAASIAEIMRQNVHAQLGNSILSHVRSYQDAAAQTPTHFISKRIDPSYDWNEWGLRRRALHLANLRRKVSKSNQTDGTAFRRDAHSQVYLSRDQETQSSVTTASAAPFTRKYIAGLRGAPDEVMESINLTIDPEVAIGRCR